MIDCQFVDEQRQFIADERKFMAEAGENFKDLLARIDKFDTEEFRLRIDGKISSIENLLATRLSPPPEKSGPYRLQLPPRDPASQKVFSQLLAARRPEKR